MVASSNGYGPSNDPSRDLSNGDERAARSHDPYSAIRIANCRSFLIGNVTSTVGAQMMYLAVAWEVFQRTSSPTALGLVGLLQVLPIILFAIPAGHLVDRFDRKKIVVIDQMLLGVVALLLAAVSFYRGLVPDLWILHHVNAFLGDVSRFLGEKQSHFADPYIPLLLGVVFLNGTIRSVNQPAKQSLLPQLVPASLFPNAASWNSSMSQVSTMIGPALAGIMLGVLASRDTRIVGKHAMVYATTAALQWLAVAFFMRTRPLRTAPVKEPVTWKSLARGVTFVWNTKIILATITVDMFSVLLGGSVALLPIFARDILQVGPAGLGWLRAAPSVGAMSMAIVLAHMPPMKRTGWTMLSAVCGFGLATIGFGLSKNFALSLLLLFTIGACDNISSIVRTTLAQMLTPDAMRGRVSAVKAVFSSTSDGLGAFESGLTAASMGPRLAVVVGGIGTLCVAAAVSVVWPQLRDFGPLHEAAPEEENAVDPQLGFDVIVPVRAKTSTAA